MSKRSRYAVPITFDGEAVVVTTALWGELTFRDIQELQAYSAGSTINPEETHYWLLIKHAGGFPYYLRCSNISEQLNIFEALEDFM